MHRLVATGLVFPPWPLLSALALLFAGVGCTEEEADDDSGPADDDDSSETEDCDPGTVLDENLPAEFLEDFPDSCVPEACGVGTWGNLEIGPDTVFVDARGGEDGGDGSQGAPFASVQAGLNAAGSSGAMVAVAAGTYVENLLLGDDHDGVYLAGRCPELVVLDGSSGDEDSSTISADGFMGGESWTVSGVTVTGGPAEGVELDDGHLILTNARVIENAYQGVVAGGSPSLLTLADVSVTDTRPDEDGMFGRGIEIWDGATLVATDCIVDGNTEIGIYVQDSSNASLTNVEVLRNQAQSDGSWGRGVHVGEHSHLQAENCRIEGNAEMGITLTGSSSASLIQVEVRDTRFLANGEFGTGIHIQDGASLRAVDCLIEDNDGNGIFAGLNSELFLSGVEVYGDSTGGERGGRGIQIQDDSSLVAEDCVVQGNVEVGIMLVDGCSGSLTRVDVTGTRPSAEQGWGVGLHAADDSTLDVTDCLLESNTAAGLHVRGDCTVSLSNVDIVNIEAEANGGRGRGIEVQEGGSLQADHLRFEGVVETALFATDEGTTVSLSDVVVVGTRRGAQMTTAAGLVAQRGAVLNVTRVDVEGTDGPGLAAAGWSNLTCTSCNLHDNRFAGVVVWGGAVLELTSTTITQTLPDASQGGGIGIYAMDELEACSLRVDDTTIEGQPYSAVWLHGDGSYDIRNSTLVGGYGYEQPAGGGETVLLHGDGVVATGGVSLWDGTQGLILEGNEILGAHRAGVILDGSSAWLSDNTFGDNATDLIWQNCDDIEEPYGLDVVPDVILCPLYNEPIAPLSFDFMMVEPEPLG